MKSLYTAVYTWMEHLVEVQFNITHMFKQARNFNKAFLAVTRQNFLDIPDTIILQFLYILKNHMCRRILFTE